MREIPYSEGDRGRSRRYDRRDDDEMYDFDGNKVWKYFNEM